ncbi:MAG: NACHT domain-containing protein [Chloroflexi bacterium]|nr:NACHT domain-containing protein [Chloroflexota bacterium]MCI0580274.1 NACHT domain-containing protein [Chloroflexota bacterium]MCI0643685.1 NACHT domain-containing protein [Chloroflexota bacterium]MCI0729069.1 NACHT domain-containing protein [Chloroflexota bacterium]
MLRELIVEHFSRGELVTLCADLGMDYDDLPGASKPEKIRELIAYMERRGRLSDLFDQLSRSRPQVNWKHPGRATVRIAPEVRGFLEATGYEILDELWGERHVIFQTQLVLPGEYLKRWLFCKDLGVTLNDVGLLEEQIATLRGSKGWMITEADVIDPDARQRIEENPDATAHTLAIFYRQTLQCDAYLQKELIAGSAEIEKYWVDLNCRVEGEGRFDLVTYVDTWLKAAAGRQLALLGDFGTGKTWFCRYYAARLARRYLKNPEENRIPVLISLREYTTALNIEQLITSTLVDVYDIRLPGGFKTFMHLNQWGRLLLIFDGFDEMEQHMEYTVALRNYREIARTMADASKMILTSRPLFFEDAQQLQAVLQSSGNQLRFETLSLWELDDEQIQELLRKRAPEKWQTSWEQVRQFARLKDLASRPVMTHIIAETLPDIDDPSRVDSAALYRIYLDRWIEEACRLEAAGAANVKDDVFAFVRDLAWELFNSRTTKTISLSELRERTGDRANSSEFNLILRQLLVHDKQTGSYTFPHVSFIEYFVADVVVEGLLSGDRQRLFVFTPTSGVLGFLTDMMRGRPDVQQGLLNALWEVETSEQMGSMVALLARLDEKQRQGSVNREGRGNPVRPVIKALQTVSPASAGASPTWLPQHVVVALGKEEFLEEVTRELSPEAPPQVRYFLLELWGSPAIGANRSLQALNQAIYHDPDTRVRLHAVQVLGQRQGKEEVEMLIETIGNQAMPGPIRQACLDSIRVSALTAESAHHLLHVLHQVIAHEPDASGLRADCITKLAEYDSREALEPLIPILKDFEHKLWLVSASILSLTSVASLADDIEKEVILPNQQDAGLAREIAHLRRVVATIRKSI